MSAAPPRSTTRLSDWPTAGLLFALALAITLPLPVTVSLLGDLEYLQEDYAGALAAYEQLAEKYPSDGEIQEELASMLALANDRRSVERALALWRTIEKRSPTATPRPSLSIAT